MTMLKSVSCVLLAATALTLFPACQGRVSGESNTGSITDGKKLLGMVKSSQNENALEFRLCPKGVQTDSPACINPFVNKENKPGYFYAVPYEKASELKESGIRKGALATVAGGSVILVGATVAFPIIAATGVIGGAAVGTFAVGTILTGVAIGTNATTYVWGASERQVADNFSHIFAQDNVEAPVLVKKSITSLLPVIGDALDLEVSPLAK